MRVHEKIRAYREFLKLKQDEFADELGVTQGAVSKWERENAKPPQDAKSVAALAEHSGYGFRYFMEDGPEQKGLAAGFAEPSPDHAPPKKLKRAEAKREIERLVIEQRGGKQKLTENQQFEITRTIMYLVEGKLLP